MPKLAATKNPLNIIVLVSALGYFVDVYDLILFSIVRVSSLKAIGIEEDQLKDAGIYLINMQMTGMLLGGIVWGILGDKRGRLSILFLTILLYSLANIANGFVQNLEQYAWLRVIAGFGLAGELGIGITLVSEVMTKESRGWGTSIVSGIGIAGAVLAFYVAEWGWREAYWAGGVLGLLLLGLRIYVHESGMFDKIKALNINRGNFFSLFSNKKRFYKYICCILIGIPAWFVIAILVTFSPEMAAYLGIVNEAGQPEAINTGKAVLYQNTGAAIGSIVTGFLSQWLRSRKKSLLIALASLSIFCAIYFNSFGVSSTIFYLIIFILGLAIGYWAVFVTVAAEQFGTNIRSTVATTVPNFVRGFTVLMTLWWSSMAVGLGILNSAIIIGASVITLAIIAVFLLKESYGKELDYVEGE